MKKSALFLLFLPLLFAASCQKEAPKSNAISAIPVRSAFVVRINSLQDLHQDIKSSLPAEALQSSMLFNDLKNFADLLNKYNPQQENDIRAFGGFDQYGAGTFGWIWSIESEEVTFISSANLAKVGTTKSREYGSSTIVHFSNDEVEFYFANQAGLTLISRQENLVESALKQLESGIDLGHDARFMSSLKTTTSRDPANVFVQYKALPDWLETLLPTANSWTENLATWSAFDLDLNVNDISFTGVSLVPDSAATYIGLFAKCGSGSNQFTEIIPQNTALAVSQTCGDFSQWQKNFDTFLGKQNKLKQRNNRLAEFNIDAHEFADLIEEEIGVFYTDGATTSTESKNGFLRCKDAEKTWTYLANHSTEFSETYRNITLKKFNAKLALPLAFGKIYSHLSTPYYFSYQKFIIFSNDLVSAKNIINNLLAEKTWANSENFNGVETLRDGDAHIIAIAHNPEWINLTEKELNEQDAKELAKNSKDFSAINWVIVQLKQNKSAAYSEVILVHETKKEQIAKQFWGFELDAPAANQPQLMRNHYTNNNEVIVQDEKHNLYLIDPNGKLLWKIGVDGPILGKIHQADLYKNNKLQLVFNTAQKMYVVDRNGNKVGNFPISLPKNATAPMAVFDYENTRNYRFVVPCGKQMLNYDLEGKKVNGWEFSKGKADLIAQPKHAIIKGKDFIYTVDALGNLYLVNRRGEIRTPIKHKMKNLASEIYLVADANMGGKLSALGKSGYTLSVFMNDAMDSIQPFSNKPKFMNADEKLQVYAAENEMYVRYEKANFDKELNEDILFEPGIFTVGGNHYFTVTTDNNEIWVFNDKGNPLPGMPLYGNGKATLGRTVGKTLHVLVSTEQGTLLDYKLME